MSAPRAAAQLLRLRVLLGIRSARYYAGRDGAARRPCHSMESRWDSAGHEFARCDALCRCPLYYKSPRGQCAVMLLAALHKMFVKDAMAIVTKRQAVLRIKMNHWFDIHDEDLEPYLSQRLLTGEPRWQTLIAWARKDSVIRDFVSYEARDAWGLTRLGRDAFERFHNLCTNGRKSISDCFLWSIQFKKFMKPDFAVAPNDKKRPTFLYRDTLRDIFAEFAV
jgi:hypothetical protein